MHPALRLLGVVTSVAIVTGPNAVRPVQPDARDHVRSAIPLPVGSVPVRHAVQAMAYCTGSYTTIYPCQQTVTGLQNTTGQTITFSISNSLTGGGSTETYALTCTNDGTVVVSCSVPSSVDVTGGHSANVTLTYATGITGGSGTVTIHAVGINFNDNVLAPMTVSVVAASVPSVTPTGFSNGAQISRFPNTQYTSSFQVANTGTDSATFNLTASCSASGWNCSVSPTSVALLSGHGATVNLTFTTTSTNVNGTIAVRAANAAYPTTADSGWLSVSVPTTVSVTPDNQAVNAPPGDGSYTFTVATTQPTSTQFALTVSCTTLTNCATTPDTVSASSSASASVPVSFHTGNVGSSGTITVTARGVADAANTDAGSATVTAVSSVYCSGNYTQITPCDSTITMAPSASGSVSFTITNTGSVADNYTLACSDSGPVSSCGVGNPSVTIGANSSVTRTVTLSTSASAGGGYVQLAAYGDLGDYVSARYSVTVSGSHSVAVTPKGTAVHAPAYYPGVQQHFAVKNTGSVSSIFSLRPSCPNAANDCTVTRAADTVAAGATDSVVVAYMPGANGTSDVIGLLAAYSGDTTVRDSGTVTVSARAVCSDAQAALDPCLPPPVTHYTNTHGAIQIFHITNYLTEESQAFTLVPTCLSPVYNCRMTTSETVDKLSTKTDTIYYDTDTIPGTGTIAISTVGLADTLTTEWSVNVTPPPKPPALHLIELTPHYQTAELDPGAVDTARFALTETAGDSAGYYKYRRTCTGTGIAGGCSPAQDSVLVTPGVQVTIPVTFTAGTAVGASGTAALTIWRAADSTVRDSGSVAVSVVRDSTTVDVASLNAGSLVDRNDCLHVSLTRYASYECGDLRLVYPLPSTRTLNSVHTPVLIYDSHWAKPYIVIAANVTLPNDGQVPTTVMARLLDSAGVKLDSATWNGSNWTAGSTRRIALIFDPVSTRNYPTGVQRYSLEISRIYASSTSRDTVTGTFFVVRRDHDDFGIGWELAGHERLFLNNKSTMYWTDAEGNARAYVQSQSDPTVWTAQQLDRPDTLRKVGNRYIRYLPHGVKVQFDTLTGCHMETVNRLGYTTSFHYAGTGCNELDTLSLPPNGNLKYVFHYNLYGSNYRLDSVTAPPVGTSARVVRLTRTGTDEVTRIADALGDTLGLRYHATWDSRVRTLIDERGDTAFFYYKRNIQGPLTADSVPIAAGNFAVTTFVQAFTRGWQGTAAVPLEQTYAKIDGPRTDVGDTTLFWVDKYGAPDRVRNALGDETLVTRDATWPTLAASVRYPSGQILGAAYDPRGNLATLTDSSTFETNPLKYATSRYTWDQKWDFVIRSVNPEGDSSTAGYDPTDGNLLWRRDGKGNEVDFHYYVAPDSAAGLLASVSYPDTTRDSLSYDPSLLNVKQVIQPLNWTTTYSMDGIGRVTRTDNPDGTVDSTVLDLLDRDTLTMTAGGSDTVETLMHYDSASNLESLTTRSIPDKDSIGSVIHVYTYDRANRKIEDLQLGSDSTVGTDTAGRVLVTWTYDPAGNLLDGGRRPTTNTYDALNRVVKRIGGVISVYAYDAMGHLTIANDPYARISRHYLTNGLLASDTLRIATYWVNDSDFTQHVYGQEYTYDLDGRRLALQYPGVAAGAATYSYAPATGWLRTVTDPFGNVFRYDYDEDGRITQLVRLAQGADSIIERRDYDPLSRLVHRIQQAGSTVLHADTLIYNGLGQITLNQHTGETAQYDTLGHLTSATFLSGNNEHYAYDALGNRVTATTPGEGDTHSYYHYVRGTNQLAWALHPGGTIADTTDYQVDPTGAVGDELHVHPYYVGTNTTVTDKETRETVNGYDVENQLISSRYTLDTTWSGTVPATYRSYWHEETYRYDALGRRVWQQMVRDSGYVAGNTLCYWHDRYSGCRNEVTRTVWDGSQMLVEIREPVDTNSLYEYDVQAGVHYGVVGYTNGPGIDAPLDLFKTSSDVVVPYTNWHGQYDAGTCPTALCSNTTIEFPGALMSSYGDAYPDGSVDGPPSWYGSVITGMQDGSGYQYRRIRYYDPKTGRFTQEDPIGLAGGLNAYGFAEGDPVSYSDPFGLCPEGNWKCYIAKAGWEGLAGLGGSALGFFGGAAAGVACGPLVEVCSPALAAAGTIAGGIASARLAGAAIDNYFESRASSHASGGSRRGFGNKRIVNNVKIGKLRVAVDAEVGGSGEPQVHVQVKGPGFNTRTGHFLINDPSDLGELPGSIRNSRVIQNAITKAFDYIAKTQ